MFAEMTRGIGGATTPDRGRDTGGVGAWNEGYAFKTLYVFMLPWVFNFLLYFSLFSLITFTEIKGVSRRSHVFFVDLVKKENATMLVF